MRRFAAVLLSSLLLAACGEESESEADLTTADVESPGSLEAGAATTLGTKPQQSASYCLDNPQACLNK